MPRRGGSISSSVSVHNYSLRSLGPVIMAAENDDDMTTMGETADITARLSNVERDLATLTAQLSQLYGNTS